MTERVETKVLKESVFFINEKIDIFTERIEILEEQINTQHLICNWLTILMGILIFFNIITILFIFFK